MQARERGISEKGEGELARWEAAAGGRGKMEKGRGKSVAGEGAEDLRCMGIQAMDGGDDGTAVKP